MKTKKIKILVTLSLLVFLIPNLMAAPPANVKTTQSSTAKVKSFPPAPVKPSTNSIKPRAFQLKTKNLSNEDQYRLSSDGMTVKLEMVLPYGIYSYTLKTSDALGDGYRFVFDAKDGGDYSGTQRTTTVTVKISGNALWIDQMESKQTPPVWGSTTLIDAMTFDRQGLIKKYEGQVVAGNITNSTSKNFTYALYGGKLKLRSIEEEERNNGREVRKALTIFSYDGKSDLPGYASVKKAKDNNGDQYYIFLSKGVISPERYIDGSNHVKETPRLSTSTTDLFKRAQSEFLKLLSSNGPIEAKDIERLRKKYAKKIKTCDLQNDGTFLCS